MFRTWLQRFESLLRRVFNAGQHEVLASGDGDSTLEMGHYSHLPLEVGFLFRAGRRPTARSSRSLVVEPPVTEIGVVPRYEPEIFHNGFWTPSTEKMIEVPPVGKQQKFITGGCLGQGSFGTVYLVLDIAGQHQAALKVLRYKNGLSKTECHSLANELRVLQQLVQTRHPHPFLLLPYLGYDRWAWYSSTGYVCTLMEFYPGGDLLQYIGRLTAPEISIVTAELILGLGWLHDRGYVHHDLKPENILVDREGHCAIADFGACRLMKNGRLVRTEKDQVIVTERYAPPELRKTITHGRQFYDQSVDIWSLGVVLAELLCETSIDLVSPASLAEFRDVLTEGFASIKNRGWEYKYLIYLSTGMLVISPPARPSVAALKKEHCWKLMDIEWSNVLLKRYPAIGHVVPAHVQHSWQPPIDEFDTSHSCNFIDELSRQNLQLQLDDDSFDVELENFRLSSASPRAGSAIL